MARALRHWRKGGAWVVAEIRANGYISLDVPQT